MDIRPFNFGTLAGEEHFCNRIIELQKLSSNFRMGINTTLVSARRWGKSSLVEMTAKHVIKKEKNIRFCYIDLFNTRSEQEFYVQMAQQLIKATSTKAEERIEAVKTFFRRLIPSIGISPDQQQEFTLSFSMKDLQRSPDEILDLAENIAKTKKTKIVVCIDEFQNIGYFTQALSFQKKLRSHWQKHKHASYCLYGSKKHMLMDIFGNVSMPFYRFGSFMFLEKIDARHWIPYIIHRFEKTGKKITEPLAKQISSLMENHPYHVQQLAQETWDVCGKFAKSTDIENAVTRLLRQMTILYQREVDLLSNMQVNFLKAVCSGVEKFSSNETLREFNLGSSANIKRVREALIEKEVIDINNDKPEFSDPLFKIWFWRIYMQRW
ncbi:MAG: hypothetical protein K2U26_03780 [Cyclobacteriaceae bacterium]|nr:hypothetical protein [Cyclobacteriaceae bacterium]